MINKKTLSEAYVARDLSWMYFNRRILQEATKPQVPLLERLSFLGIYSNNLDEFFRVRMATLSRIAECEDKSLRSEREQARQLIKQINKLNNKYAKEYEHAIHEVTRQLSEENIFLMKEDELDEGQQRFVRQFYRQRLSGFVSPVWLSAVRQLTDETDENIYLAVKMQAEGRKSFDYALIALPVAECGRFVRLPDKEGRNYLMYLDDVIRYCLPMIFSGLNYVFFKAYAFKFTKDAEMEIDNDLRNGMLQKISKGVKSRKKGDALRVIYDADMPRDVLKRVMNKLNLDKLDTVLGGGRYHNHKDLMSFPDCGRKDLKYPAWEPVIKPELDSNESLLRLIQKGDRFIHVPYHSFDYYIRVLQEAAVSKEVKSIKTTLYRLAKDSKVVKALICAARNGKKVTVVIELLARFDEASNIGWSKKMQDAGIHVIFGVEGLKVHSKITHISMKTGNDIACISTGNFHEGNARMYTDYMLMTAARNVVHDVNSVFTFIEKPYSPIRFKELLVSPNEMKQKFVKLINDEIKNKQAGKPAYIFAKINHITDAAMVKKLYEASANGVPVGLLVRGNCSLVTGIPGVSDTIRINGIIDRYLEHSRIFIFAAGGEDKTFIGSADWMPRNLDNRVEVITPVYDAQIKADLRKVIEFGLRDNCQGSIVDGSGENRSWTTESDVPFRSQEELYKSYKE
ncbi:MULTISPECIES: RNA degradosome polyphosphate kinase [Bacteroides]|uniref:RNA degradosome polyphosphate kinase n=1 Tax=Bacteroides TaxID=816 RepID=UPI000E44DBB2|nr:MULTISPECIES: RNA degradosome polyphosphate kinase [Bacteroides]MBS7574321.1 RNA degradosome polyphosphate kinase [Bacteroides propionicigenes]RGM25292.1 RNA degradosome polyphosphate kinase [Bacteroides sp. OM08-17BH]HBO05987.1 RNA degradosome polyphosphate kinase [Bacteroides sp.]